MKIPSERVLTEIERHLENARPEDPAHVRETLSAIRALCDIVLGEQPADSMPPEVRQLNHPAPPRVQQLNESVPPAPPAAPGLRERPLQEDDANGDSLFDF